MGKLPRLVPVHMRHVPYRKQKLKQAVTLNMAEEAAEVRNKP